MMMTNMRPEDIAAIVMKGIGSDFEELIYAELKAQAEVTARKVAKEIADRISANVVGYRSDADFQNRIDLQFKMIDTDSEPVGEIVDVKHGIPIVVWKSDAHDFVGKKIFIA